MSSCYYLTPSRRTLGSVEPISPSAGRAAYPGAEPVIPLPDVGEGGPVYPGGSGRSSVRFLNAAYNYPALRISVANSRFINRLGYASVSGYGRVRAGYQTVTVASANGRIYLRKTMPFQANGLSTVAVINTSGGLDLLQIADSCCPPGGGYASFRVGNLAYNSGPMDVLMSDGRVVYGDLRFKEIGAFKRIVPGTYQFFYADTSLSPMRPSLSIEPLDPAWLGVYPPYETFGSLYLDIASGGIYTVYLLQKGAGRNNIQNLILVDQ